MGKYLHKSKSKVNIPLRAAGVLYCLTVLSIYLVSGLYARYTASSQSADQARVAKFAIQGSETLMQSIQAECAPGEEPIEKPLVIHNVGEVAVEYSIAVANETKNLPLTVQLIKKDSEGTGGTGGDTFTGQQLPGAPADNYTLVIQWDGTKNDPDYMGMVDYITVTVTATQID